MDVQHWCSLPPVLRLALVKESIVDSLPQSLLEGRPGSSLLLTPHQLQQLQQLQAQQEQAGGALTLTLQHQHSAGAGCLAPQLVLAPPQSFAYQVPQCAPSATSCVHHLSSPTDTQSSPIIQHIGHTSILQSSIQHHVRQSSIQQVIQQVGQTSIQQVGMGVGSQGVGVGGKCVNVSASPGSPFSSRSLTPSPQQRVVTPQPHQLHQVMGAPGQVLQIFHQQATRNTVTGSGVGVNSVKPKQPPQILPKPPGSGATSTAKVAPSPQSHTSSPQLTTLPQQQQGTLVFNQMLPSGPVLVQQQTSSGLQLILRSPPPPQAQPKSGSIVLSANGGLTPQGTVLLQGRQQAQQVVRLIAGQSLQLQQIQTSSGPTLIAVPSLQASPAPTPPANTAQQTPTIRTVTAPSPTLIKKNKKKKKKDEEPRLDLANLMKLSGIEEEDVAPVSIAQPIPQQQQQLPHQQQQPLTPQPQFVQSSSPRLVVTPPQSTTPKQQQSQLLAQLQAPSQYANQGLRLSLGEDGRMLVHQNTPQINPTTTVTPSVAAAAHSQLAQLLAEHGGQILQNNSAIANSGGKEAALLQSLQTAVLSWAGTDSLVMKGGGMTLGTPSVVINTAVRRPPNAPTSVVVANPSLIDTSQQNGVRIVADINGLTIPAQTQAGQNRLQVVPNSAVALEHQNRVQIVSGVTNSSALSLTEQQNRVQIVSGVPTSSAMSLTEQNRVQIVSGVPNSSAVSLTEQQNRVQIVSGVPSSTQTAMSLTEQQNRVQIVSGVPSSTAVSLTEQQNRVQIVSSVPSSTAMSLSEQNRVQIVSSVPNSTAMSLTEQQNRIQIVSGVPNTSSVSLAEQNRVQIVSGAPSSTTMSLTEQQNRVQIVSGVPNPNSMSLTEQQNRLQVLAGSKATNGLSLTEHQNRVQIVSGVPSASAMSLTEQQNRVQIVSGVPTSSSMSLTEQQNSVQIVSAIPSSNSMSLAEQQNRVHIVSGVPNPAEMSMCEQNRVQIVSGVPSSSAMSLEQQQNRLHIVSGIHNTSAMSLTEQQNRVQIVSGVPNSSGVALTEQQNRVHILSSGTNTNAMSLTEQQNRVQIISSVPNSNSMSLTEEQNRLQIVSGVPNSASLSLTEQQNRVQIVAGMSNSSSLSLSEQQNSRVQIVSSLPNCNSMSLSEQNRVHIVSGVSGDQQNRVHLVSGIPASGNGNVSLIDQPNRVQIVSGIPNRTSLPQSDHQNRVHVLSGISNGSIMSVTEHNRAHIATSVSSASVSENQSRVQVVQSMPNQNPILSDQNRVHIVAGVPNNILSLNEQQNRLHLLSTSGHSEENISVPLNSSDQQRVQIVTSLPNAFNEHRVQIVTSMPNVDQSKISVVTSSGGMSLSDHQRLHIVTGVTSANSNTLPQNDHHVHIITSVANTVPLNDRFKNSSCIGTLTNEQQRLQSSGVQTVEHMCRPQFQQNSKPQSRSPHIQQYSQPVNSPRCNPSPQSPRGNSSKSPVAFPQHSPVGSPQQQQLQQQQQPSRTSFPNRPHLTVVTQQSPGSYNQSTLTSHHSTDNHTVVNPFQQYSNPSKVVTTASHVNHQVEGSNHQSVITSLANSQNSGNSSKPLQAVIRQPPRPQQSNTNFQNSFLESIAQSHPNLVINKSPTSPVAAKALKPKKQPKKSAVVKPMMLEELQGNQNSGPQCEKEQEPPNLVPISTHCDTVHTPNMVQRVQTIQLTPQKQQHLKTVQNQISVLSSKKTRTPGEQAALQRLFVEQQKILFSGKLIPTIPGQHAQGITFQVSTPVRVLPPPVNSPRQFPPTPPTTASKATSPLHVQVGTQTTCEPSPSPPTINYSKRAALIEQQLRADRAGATAPDTNTPFASISDACKRLVRYHCLDDPVLSERDLEKADEIFEATARHLLDKNAQMLNKYNYLLLMESMRQVQTSELIMLGRMFISEETARLEQMRQEAQAPPPPPPPPPTPPTSNPPLAPVAPSVLPVNVKRECDDSEESVPQAKKHCPDDEEINAQVQNAIDSILNLQKSDPALDEAVRSILTS